MRPPSASSSKNQKTKNVHVKKQASAQEESGQMEGGHASSVSSSTATGMTMVVNEEDFFHYTNFRILDSIGYPGAYRKFLLRRKDQGSEWAIKMNNHVVVVQHSIRELSILEQVSLSVAHAACGLDDWGGG